MMQAPAPLHEAKQLLDLLWYWGKIVFALGSFVAAVILARARVQGVIGEMKLLREVVERGFEKVGSRIDKLEDCDATHNTRISVLEDRDTRRRGDRRSNRTGTSA